MLYSETATGVRSNSVCEGTLWSLPYNNNGIVRFMTHKEWIMNCRTFAWWRRLVLIALWKVMSYESNKCRLYTESCFCNNSADIFFYVLFFTLIISNVLLNGTVYLLFQDSELNKRSAQWNSANRRHIIQVNNNRAHGHACQRLLLEISRSQWNVNVISVPPPRRRNGHQIGGGGYCIPLKPEKSRNCTL